MTDSLTEIKALQKQIVKALELGEDPAPILQELADLRASIAMAAEREEFQKIADARQRLRDKAEAVKATTQKQGAAIDTVLQKRDILLAQLKPFMQPLQELAEMASPSWERFPGSCYLYSSPAAFQGSVISIPRELLGADFSCPTLEMTEPGEHSPGKMVQALQYLAYCLGILQSFRKGSMLAHPRPTDGSLLLDSEPYPEPYPDPPCKVCQHPEREAIDSALTEGASLRDIASQYGISKSTVDRHKAHRKALGSSAEGLTYAIQG